MNILSLLLIFALQNPSSAFVDQEQAGMAAQKQGQLEVAIGEFQKATELNPQSAVSFFNLGVVYMQSHRYGEAIKPLKRALELHGDFPGIHASLSYALLSQGYTAEALPQFQAANTREGLGIAQLELGDLADAVSNLEAALANHPDNPDLLYYFGRATGLLSRQVDDKLLSAYPDSARLSEPGGELFRAPPGEAG